VLIRAAPLFVVQEASSSLPRRFSECVETSTAAFPRHGVLPTRSTLTHSLADGSTTPARRRVLPSNDAHCGVDIQTATSDKSAPRRCAADKRLNLPVADKNTHTHTDDELIPTASRRRRSPDGRIEEQQSWTSPAADTAIVADAEQDRKSK